MPEVTPLALRRKPLPAVGGLEGDAGGNDTQAQQTAPGSSQTTQQREDSPLARESYEYLTAMVDYSGTPQQNLTSPPPGAAQGHAPGEGLARGTAGYGSGKFSTNLDELR